MDKFLLLYVICKQIAFRLYQAQSIPIRKDGTEVQQRKKRQVTILQVVEDGLHALDRYALIEKANVEEQLQNLRNIRELIINQERGTTDK